MVNANLLAHFDFFAAGIAYSGAYKPDGSNLMVSFYSCPAIFCCNLLFLCYE